MNPLREPTASVTAAGVVAIIGSVLALLATAGIFAIVLTMPMTPPAGPPLPSFARTLTAGTMTFFFGLAIFGVFTGVSVLRLKNWARISMLVCSGITAAICGCVLAFLMFVPFPVAPDAPANIATAARVGAGIFYAVPLVVAIWWLVLFSRKGVAAQFVAPGALDASGFPAGPTLAPRPPLPLPVTVLGVFLLLSSLSIFFVFFMRMPLVLFAHAFRGPGGTVAWIGTCLVSTAAGIGLLCRKRWSHALTLGLQLFWFLSGIVTVFSPNYADLMHEAMSSITFSTGPVPQYSIEQMRRISEASMLFPVLIGIVLLYYRARFLEASATGTQGS